jgi:hypothetical protein
MEAAAQLAKQAIVQRAEEELYNLEGENAASYPTMCVDQSLKQVLTTHHPGKTTLRRHLPPFLGIIPPHVHCHVGADEGPAEYGSRCEEFGNLVPPPRAKECSLLVLLAGRGVVVVVICGSVVGFVISIVGTSR